MEKGKEKEEEKGMKKNCLTIKNIQNDFLKNFRDSNGVYFISQDKVVNKEEYILIKIGVGTTTKPLDPSWPEKKKNKTGLESRLDSYLLYYPRGYYIYNILTCKNGDDAKKMERMIHGSLNEYKVNLQVKHTHAAEWFELRLKDMNKIIKTMKTKKKVII